MEAFYQKYLQILIVKMYNPISLINALSSPEIKGAYHAVL